MSAKENGIVKDMDKVNERAAVLMKEVKDKKELLEIATELQVPGRHKMNMGQLATAIAEAEINEVIKANVAEGSGDDDGWGDEPVAPEGEDDGDAWPEDEVSDEAGDSEVDGDVGEAPMGSGANEKQEQPAAKESKKEDDEWDKDHTSPEEKARFIDMAICGRTIVAYLDSRGRTRSAMIVKRKKADKRLMLRTAYGKEMVVSYDDIIWVRAGRKWPKGVYCALKGMTEAEFDAKESARCADETLKPGA